MKLKKIGSCKTLKTFGENVYEIEMLETVVISPIFNIADMYLYRGDGVGGSRYQKKIHWEKQMPVAEKS
jgi:hypothetical protein